MKSALQPFQWPPADMPLSMILPYEDIKGICDTAKRFHHQGADLHDKVSEAMILFCQYDLAKRS